MGEIARRRFLKGVAGSTTLSVAGAGQAGAAGRRYSFVQWDVFTSERLKGNPLAVFTDASGLEDGDMAAIARETHLSETTFIFPREAAIERERGVLVRIFTPREELPFAGHPTLGTAMELRSSRMKGAAEISLELKAGKIPVTFHNESDGQVFGEMRQKDAEFGETHPRDAVAPLVGLKVDDIADDVPIQAVSTGSFFVILPLKSLAAIRSLRMNFAGISEYLARSGRRNFYCVTRETENPKARLHTRLVNNGGEDPATGSAAGCTAAWMVKNGVARPNEQVLIEQGAEVSRQGYIFVRAALQGQSVVDVRVGGHAVEVIRGEYSI
jgi:trans-2,3-dihydro-3-hydroxyanthranilate isomerase